MHKRMMKKTIEVGKNLFIPTCALMISYCIFYQYIEDFTYLFVVKLILFLLFVFQTIIRIIDIFGSEKKVIPRLSNNLIIKGLYLRSKQIITFAFGSYFVTYGTVHNFV